jgi:hypothetical protein
MGAKTIGFHVNVTFADEVSVSPKNQRQIAQNILDGLVDKVSNSYIAPENSETYTVEITVTPNGQNFTLRHEI